MGSARSLQTGEVPESLQQLWNQFQDTSIYRTVKQELDSVLLQYPEEYHGLKQITEKIKISLAKDFEKQRQNLMQLRKPRQILYWIVNHLNFVSLVLQKIACL